MSYLCRFTSGIISLPFHNNLTVDPASQPRPHCSFCANKRALWCCFALYTNINFTGAGVLFCFLGRRARFEYFMIQFRNIFTPKFMSVHFTINFFVLCACVLLFCCSPAGSIILLLLEKTSPIHRRHASVEVAWMKWRMDRFTAFLPPLALVVFRLLMALDRHINVEKLRHELRFYVLCCPSFDTAPGRAINYISHKPARVLIIMADVVYHTSPLIHAIVRNKCRMGQ